MLNLEFLEDCIKPRILELCVRKYFCVTLTPFRCSFTVQPWASVTKLTQTRYFVLKSIVWTNQLYCAHRPSHCIDEIYITKCLRGAVLRYSNNSIAPSGAISNLDGILWNWIKRQAGGPIYDVYWRMPNTDNSKQWLSIQTRRLLIRTRGCQ